MYVDLWAPNCGTDEPLLNLGSLACYATDTVRFKLHSNVLPVASTAQALLRSAGSGGKILQDRLPLRDHTDIH
jgi:hypothetical protein